jgi:hypothetical protein
MELVHIYVLHKVSKYDIKSAHDTTISTIFSTQSRVAVIVVYRFLTGEKCQR